MPKKDFAKRREEMVKKYIDADLLEENSRLAKVRKEIKFLQSRPTKPPFP